MAYPETTPTAADSIERLSRATLRVSKAISPDDNTLVAGLYAGLDRIAASLSGGEYENVSTATVLSGKEVRAGLDGLASAVTYLAEVISAASATRS
jgi:hypothetical protein